jgi:hypothetical protein
MADPVPPDPSDELQRLRRDVTRLQRLEAMGRFNRGVDNRSFVRRHPWITAGLAGAAVIFSGGLNQADRFADWTARQFGARGWRTEPDDRPLMAQRQAQEAAVQAGMVAQFEERVRLAQGQPPTTGLTLLAPRTIRGLAERLQEIGAPESFSTAGLPGGARDSDFGRAIVSAAGVDRAHIVALNARGIGQSSGAVSIASVLGTDRRATMVLDLSRIPGAREGGVDIVFSGERSESVLNPQGGPHHLGRGQYVVPDTGDAGRLMIYRRGDRSQPLFQMELDRTRTDFYNGLQDVVRRDRVLAPTAPGGPAPA